MADIIVQKFGGTSVANFPMRQKALDHVEKILNTGTKVVMVVSAMGRTGAPYATDSLLNLVGGDTSRLSPVELDQVMGVGELLAMSVILNEARQRGLCTVGFTGAQAGILTTNDYQNARILKVDPTPVMDALKTVDLVVVCGFQGESTEGRPTTLGRGGSDTSAVALGAAVKARYVDIFTDVAGVMTADPKEDPNARLLPLISYEKMEEMANNGAKVLHPRAVHLAAEANIPLRVRATDPRVTGSTIVGDLHYFQKAQVI